MAAGGEVHLSADTGGVQRERRSDRRVTTRDVGRGCLETGSGVTRRSGPSRRVVGQRPGSAERSWGWLLLALGYEAFQTWEHGRSWRLRSTYIVVDKSPDVVEDVHERRAPGLNHLAFHVGDRADVDLLVGECGDRGWTVMFADRHPYAGGQDHYAAYLENEDGLRSSFANSAADRIWTAAAGQWTGRRERPPSVWGASRTLPAVRVWASDSWGPRSSRPGTPAATRRC